ncbi:V/A-type H+-transporting ATPase subunit C [Methanolinea mesophila]|uniref:V-type ATP synthase subunit C n=1 Tax=Methanolinea mesophila TaxID=547055 RepID=UPI001AE7DF05|nr:V-type ATP synthase subunit C [Methanolinea mesophila]MBP1928002.1 V/A-type H+-transporting ATPase subunit C [Methanolinea mesophila]
MVTARGGGPAPYIYVCTRMRVRKSKLLPREEYLRMLNMSLPEIARIIEETEYKKEIDELATSFKGVDLIEIGISWNMAKEFQKIIEIAPGNLKDFTRLYLRRWDIQNILTILRGKSQGSRPGKIKEVLIPAGELDRVFLDRLLSEESIERIVELLKGRRIYPVIARELPAALESGVFSHMENELYKQFYGDLLSETGAGLRGGIQFKKFLELDIDLINIRNMFRLRADSMQEDARDLFIPGATFTEDEFQRMISMESQSEFIDSMKMKIRSPGLLQILESLREKGSLREIEIDLIRVQIEQMEKLAKIYPFSIHPILAYLERKKYEVFNLRAIARGKAAELPGEELKQYLVI